MLVTNELPTTIHIGLDVAKLTLQVDLAGRELALPNYTLSDEFEIARIK